MIRFLNLARTYVFMPCCAAVISLYIVYELEPLNFCLYAVGYVYVHRIVRQGEIAVIAAHSVKCGDYSSLRLRYAELRRF